MKNFRQISVVELGSGRMKILIELRIWDYFVLGLLDFDNMAVVLYS